MKRAVITGINGQDGSYLAELLLEKGYTVYGMVRRHSVSETQSSRVDHLTEPYKGKLFLEYGDMTDAPSLYRLLQQAKPDEIYNLAAQSHVRISFDQPQFTTLADANGVLNLLEAARSVVPYAKIYQAGSSEMYGNEFDSDNFRRETTPMRPVSPYACAKLYAFNLARTYRSSYGMFITNGILFNHESPRRGINFVTNKVVDGAVKIKKGLQDKLELGNLEATRDWGHARDYVEAMWMMLQHSTPKDYVCATGKSHSVRELCDYVFSYLGMDYRDHVITNVLKYERPTELHDLRGDSTLLREELGWKPKYTFESMLQEMIEARL